MIADNELDFHVSYENKDEMGTLCKEFVNDAKCFSR